MTDEVVSRDAVGLRPVYYARAADGYRVASTAAELLHHLPKVTLSRSWLALYLAGKEGLCFGTPFEEIREVPPGHELILRGGSAKLRRHHTFDTRAEVTSDSTHVIRRYREAFREAVRSAILTDGAVAAENSGGLDSASVIAMANSLGSSDRVGFSFGFAQFAGDVPAMRQVAAVANVEHRVFGPPTWQRVEGLFRASCKTLGFPPRTGVMYAVAPGVDWVRGLGIKVVLSGWGGDHVITSSAGGASLELARRGDVVRLLRSQERGMRGALRAGRALLSARRPPVRSLDPVQDLSGTVLSSEAIWDLKLPATIDTFYWGWNSCNTLNEFLVERRLPLARSRAAESFALRDVLGVEYRYPMLDERLIQVYLSSPTHEKMGNGWGRYLHRRALEGIVPSSVLWQRDKTTGVNCYQPPDTSDRRLFQPDQVPPPVRELLSPETLRQPGEGLESIRHVCEWVSSLEGKAWG